MDLRNICFALCVQLVCVGIAAAQPAQDLGKIVITSTRVGQSEYNLSGNVTVIKKEDIQAANADTVPDLLKEAIGVNVYEKGTSKSATVDIRGFGDAAASNVLFLVNGRKINSVDLSGPDLIQVPVDAVERIEIIRGAASVLYGDNAVGGVVNIITKKGEGDFSGRLSGTYGSYDRRKGEFQASGEENGLSYYLYSSYFDEKGYRANSDVLSRDFNTRMTYDWGKWLDIDLEIGRHDDKTLLPGGLDETELQTLGRQGSADTSRSETLDMFYKLGFSWSPWEEEGQWGRFVVDVTYRDRDVFDSFFGTFNSDRSIGTVGILGKYVFDRTIFGRDVNFVTGIDYYGTENDILGSGTNTDNITIDKQEFGIYTFLEYEMIDGVYVNAGARYNQAEYTFDDRGTGNYITKEPDEWVSMFGLKYQYAPGSNIHFNMQQTFRFLATDEWYSSFAGLNTNLEQQTGKQFEAGIKHAFGNKATVFVTPYWIEINDEIYYNPATFSNANYPKTRRVGVELGTDVNLLKWVDSSFLSRWDMKLSYTFEDAEFVDGSFDGNTIPLVPGNQFKHTFTFGFWDHFLLSLSGRYVGRRVIGNDLNNDKTKAGSYYVVDTKLAYLHENFEVFFEVNNLFHEQYNTYEIEKNAAGATRDAFPAEEINYNVGIALKW